MGNRFKTANNQRHSIVRAARTALWLLRGANSRTPVCIELAPIRLAEVKRQFKRCDANYGDVPFESRELEDSYAALKESVGNTLT